jgi:hypothetical protein
VAERENPLLGLRRGRLEGGESSRKSLRFCSALALPTERWEERLDACRFGSREVQIRSAQRVEVAIVL